MTAFSIAKDLELTKSFKEVATGDKVDEEYKKGELEFEEVYPEGYGYDEYDEEKDYDEEE